MKIPNKQQLYQLYLIICQIDLSDNFKDAMNPYKKSTEEPYSFLVIDTTLASDNPLRFRKNLLEKIKNLIMTIGDKIRDEKL